LLPQNIHPHYRAAVRTIIEQQQIEIIDVPYQKESGQIDFAKMQTLRMIVLPLWSFRSEFFWCVGRG